MVREKDLHASRRSLKPVGSSSMPMVSLLYTSCNEKRTHDVISPQLYSDKVQVLVSHS